jgi:diaminopimelate epimerase
MTNTLFFSKMHGLGNDFVIINAIDQSLTLSPEKIRAWADRHQGIGFDQLLVISAATQENVDFNYRIFNADGKEVEQCGNGVRCVAQFIHEKKLSEKKELRLATPFAIMTCNLIGNQQVRVNMGRPNFAPASLPFITASQSPYYDLPYHNRFVSFGAVSIGNPHVVFDVPDCSQADVELLGNFFNQNPAFPQSVNVGFMQIIAEDHIKLRVYERGVGETLACGTGACAAVSVGQLWQFLTNRVRVSLTGGDLLIERNVHDDLLMTGPAITVFDAKLYD